MIRKNKKVENKIFAKNKKAAIGSAMTWIVATFIILLIVVFFIYSSYILAKKKQISSLGFFEFGSVSAVSMDSEQTLLAILNTKSGRTKLRTSIRDGGYGNSQQIVVGKILNTLPQLKSNAFVYLGNYRVDLIGWDWELSRGWIQTRQNLFEVNYG
jgi:hypothetical protein